MGKSNISYLDMVWNVCTGCSGKGCQANCYAREMVKRFPAIHFTGDILNPCPPFSEVVFHPNRLDEPLRWKKPRVVGVCFFGDWMDDQVKPAWIDQILEVIAACPQHQFVALTKQAQNLEPKIYGPDKECPIRELGGGDYLPNLWHGVTVCTQAEADEKIPLLLQIPGKKWLSIEPMLGTIDLTELCLEDGIPTKKDIKDAQRGMHYLRYGTPRIDAVILGGESGPKARPMHPDWVRSIRDQCAVAGVPFYFKQWSNQKDRILDGRIHDDLPWREK